MQQSEWHYGGKIFATHKQKATLPGHRFNDINGKMWRERISMYTDGEV